MPTRVTFYKLQTDEVRRQIQLQALKRWWVAEQIGVHKTTLRRWMSGKIEKVRASHVAGLARTLTLPAEVIARPCLRDNPPLFSHH